MVTHEDFEDLFDQYVDEVTAFLYTYSSDYAQIKDWVQEVFIRLWKSRETIDFGHVGFKSYLFTTARNHALKKIKKEKRYGEWLEQNLIRVTELYKRSEEDNDNSEIKRI